MIPVVYLGWRFDSDVIFRGQISKQMLFLFWSFGFWVLNLFRISDFEFRI